MNVKVADNHITIWTIQTTKTYALKRDCWLQIYKEYIPDKVFQQLASKL